jgi:hypothetical protein
MQSHEAQSSSRAPSMRWSWVQFVCAFLFVGLVAFLHIDPPFDGLWAHLGKTLLVAGASACFAGRFGDAAWHVMLRVLRWM